jgi:hypothetical protein
MMIGVVLLACKLTSAPQTSAYVTEEPYESPTLILHNAPTVDPGSISTLEAELTLQARDNQEAAYRATQSARTATSTQLAEETPIPPTETPTPSLSPTPVIIQGMMTPTFPAGGIVSGTFRSIEQLDRLIPGDIRDLHIATDGTVWLFSELGVASLSNGVWTVHFRDGAYYFTGFDWRGKPWLITGDGSAILVWDGVAWKCYCQDQGWEAISFHPSVELKNNFIPDSRGRIWITTEKDVRSFDGSRWRIYTLEDMGFEETEETADYDGFYLPVVHVDRQGRVWVGDCDFQGESPVGQGARWFDGNTWVGDDTPVNDGCVMDIESDRQGRIWIGLDQELWRYNPEENNWTSIDPPDAPAGRFGWIQDLEFDQNGELWPTFIGCGGASCDTYRLRYHLQGNEWNQIDDLGDYKDQGILFDPSGGAWLMGNENIYQVRGESLREVSNLTVLAAAQDPEGWLWLAAEYQGRTFLWRQIPSNESP